MAAHLRCAGDRCSWLLSSPPCCRFVFSDYHLFQLTMVVVYAIAILGMNMLTGFNGQISLGHGAFYAVGAYTTADPDGPCDVPVLGDAAGLGGRLRGRRLSHRAAGAAAGRPLSGADHLRARRRGAADAEVQAFEDWTGGVQGIVSTSPTRRSGCR